MAKVFDAPTNVVKWPDFDEFIIDNAYDFDAHVAAEDAAIEQVVQFARSQAQGELVGEIVRFPCADGYAIYVVASEKPLTLLWCEVGDAWEIDPAYMRGLRISDIRANVARRKRLQELFPGPKPAASA